MQAKANRGILYVDEVNLLDDGLVDVVLDSAASGVNTVEREGVSIVHPAKVSSVLFGLHRPCCVIWLAPHPLSLRSPGQHSRVHSLLATAIKLLKGSRTSYQYCIVWSPPAFLSAVF